MSQGLIPFSESQNQYDFDQVLFISSRFTLVLRICREEIGIWPESVCVCDFCFCFGPSVKFILLQGWPPQSSFLIPMNFLCISAPLPGLTLTFICGWLGCLSRIVFVSCKARMLWFGSLFWRFLTVSCWMNGSYMGSAFVKIFSLLWAPEAIEVMMRLPSCSSHTGLIPTSIQTEAEHARMPAQHTDINLQHQKRLVWELSCLLKSGPSLIKEQTSESKRELLMICLVST